MSDQANSTPTLRDRRENGLPRFLNLWPPLYTHHPRGWEEDMTPLNLFPAAQGLHY